MDTDPLNLIRKVWKHSGIKGNVWVPHIVNIGDKSAQRFREGAPLPTGKPVVPELRDSVDWYWTPAVSRSDRRKARDYPAQRVIWVDCDDSFNDKLLTELRPSYVWETSPGHKQAIWLMSESIPPGEYHRDGLMGMLTQALGADPSGVDITQLLRVPGTWHHKREPFQGKILRSSGTLYTRGRILTRVARGLGFSPGLASELGAKETFGDRSKVLWRFSRNAAELGIPEDLTFKLLKATDWNKWKDEPELLREDVSKAYKNQPIPSADPEQAQAAENVESDVVVDEEVEPWGMATVDKFGPLLRKPVNWILPKIIAEASCGLIVAAPKVGKTRVAIEMALGLATGDKPLGISTKGPQNVGFFSLEDGEYLFAERLAAGMAEDRAAYHWDGHITRNKGTLVWEPTKPMSLLTHFSPVDLTEPKDKQRLLETIVKYDLKMVIIDTLSMAIGQANVSDQKEMNGVLKDVREIAKATRCAVMFIHHTRKRVFEKGESIQESILGATALHAWSEFTLSLASPAEGEDFLRLGVQTKRGNYQHYLTSNLKIIKKPEGHDD